MPSAVHLKMPNIHSNSPAFGHSEDEYHSRLLSISSEERSCFTGEVYSHELALVKARELGRAFISALDIFIPIAGAAIAAYAAGVLVSKEIILAMLGSAAIVGPATWKLCNVHLEKVKTKRGYGRLAWCSAKNPETIMVSSGNNIPKTMPEKGFFWSIPLDIEGEGKIYYSFGSFLDSHIAGTIRLSRSKREVTLKLKEDDSWTPFSFTQLHNFLSSHWKEICNYHSLGDILEESDMNLHRLSGRVADLERAYTGGVATIRYTKDVLRDIGLDLSDEDTIQKLFMHLHNAREEVLRTRQPGAQTEEYLASVETYMQKAEAVLGVLGTNLKGNAGSIKAICNDILAALDSNDPRRSGFQEWISAAERGYFIHEGLL